jgi:hypothetical protein
LDRLRGGFEWAADTRAFIQAGEDFYLCPLSATQLPAEALEGYLQPVWTAAGQPPLTSIYREQANGEQILIAEGHERWESLSAGIKDQSITWMERRLVIRSVQHTEAAEAALQARLSQAKQSITGLNVRKRGKAGFTHPGADVRRAKGRSQRP